MDSQKSGDCSLKYISALLKPFTRQKVDYTISARLVAVHVSLKRHVCSYSNRIEHSYIEYNLFARVTRANASKVVFLKLLLKKKTLVRVHIGKWFF